MWFANRQAEKPNSGWTKEQVSDLLFYGMLGVILGGRFGYVLFYQFSYFLENPLYLFRIDQGGMSFHGGFLGVMLAMWLFARKNQKNLWDILDFGAPMVPIGLGAGRIIYQNITRIDKAIADGEFDNNPVYVDAIDKAVTAGNTVHILGLLSPGGVHSHEDHIIAAAETSRGSSQIPDALKSK